MSAEDKTHHFNLRESENTYSSSIRTMENPTHCLLHQYYTSLGDVYYGKMCSLLEMQFCASRVELNIYFINPHGNCKSKIMLFLIWSLSPSTFHYLYSVNTSEMFSPKQNISSSNKKTAVASRLFPVLMKGTGYIWLKVPVYGLKSLS